MTSSFFLKLSPITCLHEMPLTKGFQLVLGNEFYKVADTGTLSDDCLQKQAESYSLKPCA
ncbi:hypothetical protein CNR22_04510 [Sphingobacteriaceae bacterium]|nr:hypothetical protein CNR22_04510 [Sphingobacteriaceae bacterium]